MSGSAEETRQILAAMTDDPAGQVLCQGPQVLGSPSPRRDALTDGVEPRIDLLPCGSALLGRYHQDPLALRMFGLILMATSPDPDRELGLRDA